MHTVEFDLDGVIQYAPANLPGPDLARLQGAMFLDRADLWPICKPRRRPKAPPPAEQGTLPLETP